MLPLSIFSEEAPTMHHIQKHKMQQVRHVDFCMATIESASFKKSFFVVDWDDQWEKITQQKCEMMTFRFNVK